VQQRLAEIDRITSTTSFNGQKILDGTFGNASFQVGANVGETIDLDLTTSMRQADIGSIVTATTSTTVETVTTGSSFVTGTIADFDFAIATVGIATASTTLVQGIGNEGSDGDTTNSYVLTFSDENGQDFSITSTNSTGPANFAITLRNDLVSQGFDTNTGAGEVNGYTLDIGTASDLLDALDTGKLTVQRADGANFTTVDVATGYSVSDPAIVGTTPTTNGVTDTTKNKVIQVDGGLDITLSGTTETDAVNQLQAALDIQSSGTYTVSSTGGVMTIASATGAAAVITGPDALLFTTDGAATDGSLSIASGELQIQIGNAAAVNVAAGDYSTTQALVDAVNTTLAGNGTAELNNDGTMSIYSSETVTVSGAAATTLGLAGTTAATGSLSTVDVKDVTSANDAIRRIDAALTSISDLRSTFGAVQNRFESTISNLGTAVENLSAARSRILDADFAAETADLTRAQILQQAGTAMLSQANALPQNVLSLLG
jgi:flagellin